MAAYQFVIELIPRIWVEKNITNLNLLFDDEFYDLSIAWNNYKPTKEIQTLLSQVLQENKSWNENMQLWGEEEANDIQLIMDNSKIDSIKIRLDLRKNIKDLKLKIVNLANQLDCYFLIPKTREIVKPEIKALDKAISDSNAAKFVTNPKKYLDEMTS